MLTATLDPFRQLASSHRSEVPPLPHHGSFLVRRGLFAEGQFEPPPAYERALGFVEARKFPISQVGSGFFLGPRSPRPPEDSLVRELRQSSTGLREGSAIPPTPTLEPAQPEPDALPFLMAVRRFVESEHLAIAREMLNSVPTYILTDPLVARLRSVLALPVVTRVPKRDVDRTLEYEWLRTEGSKYRGRWVALDGNNLLATAASLRELRELLKSVALPRPALLHRLE